MAAVAFGIFDHLDRGDEPIGALYEQRLRLVEAADAGGFRTYHVAEHHATPLGMAPSPGVYLAAVAQRTRRLRFGPLVYLLPLYTPLRLIEEICMLDQLSGGRFELRVARPAYQRWYESLTHLWRQFNTVPLRFADTLDRAIENDTAVVGSPATVRAEVERHLAATGCNYFVGRFVYGNMPADAAARSLDLFAREVIPHFSR